MSQNAAHVVEDGQAGFSYGRRARMTAMMIRWYGGAVSHRCRRPLRAPSLQRFQLNAQNGRKKRTAESRRRMARDESVCAAAAVCKPPGSHLPWGHARRPAVPFFGLCFGEHPAEA